MTAETDRALPEVGHRYIGLRCPLCKQQSLTIDQQKDPARRQLTAWWQKHLQAEHPRPGPMFESRRPPDSDEREGRPA